MLPETSRNMVWGLHDMLLECIGKAIHIPRSRANFSSKNKRRWQIGVQISKQQKPKITCGVVYG
ncbi:hypothetical protein Peur_010003 [Populus x canadensis]